ncbi:MAG: HAD family hydrolase [Planctomycetota bacterium]|nr:HAD family hydrolase [Planctomycetota bacterium]
MSAIRIAMWSGPRNISTALMRSFGNRPDTFVSDEPLYAHYLAETGIEHPGRDEILEQCEIDWRAVVDELTGPVPGDRTIWYQKHMAQHLLPHIGRDWLDGLVHAFLIRDPGEMLRSLDKVMPDPGLSLTGLVQQVEIHRWCEETGGVAPPVVDTRDVLEHPEAMLRKLCETLGIDFLGEMLAWPAGKRETDGVWAPHWYAAVERSTGFEPYRPKDEPLPGHLSDVYEQCLEPYGYLHERRLTP